MHKKSALLTFALLSALAVSSSAQIMSSASVVTFRHVPGQDVYSPGGSFQMVFEVDVKRGWHVQSGNPDMAGLVATQLSLTTDSPATFGRASFPKPSMERFSFSEKPIPTFKGKFYIGLAGALPEGMAEGDIKAEAVLRIQACDEASCIAPAQIKIEIPMRVGPKGAAAKPLNEDIYKAAMASFAAAAPSAGGGQGMGDIGGYIQSKGFALTFLLIFLGGLALNLTPCVYPLIPITVSFFGGGGEADRTRLILKAVLYFLGMTVMYSALGVVAALTGSLFGVLLQHWAVILLLAAMMVGLSLSMFGLYDVRIPDFLSELGGANREGLIGSFLMGLTAGIIAAPCIGPFVLGLLTFVGERGDPALGFIMFFTLAAGLGAPYVALAVFSGGINLLPRSGMWMVWVKKVFGFVLLGMALYFLRPLIPMGVYLPLFAAFMAGAGIYLGFFARLAGASGGFRAVQAAVGLLAMAGGTWLFMAGSAPAAPGIKWDTATLEALEKAKAEKVPVALDFTADWCIPCKELEHYTFSDPRVVKLSAKLRPLKVDLTAAGAPAAEDLKKKFAVQGVPTVVFLDSNGEERKDLRFVGFVDAGGFLDRLKKLMGG
jgi:thiol:disulfide interchange protein DsbD